MSDEPTTISGTFPTATEIGVALMREDHDPTARLRLTDDAFLNPDDNAPSEYILWVNNEPVDVINPERAVSARALGEDILAQVPANREVDLTDDSDDGQQGRRMYQ